MVRFEPRGYSYKHLRSWFTSLEIFNWYLNLITHCISSVMNLISKLQEVLKCPVPNCHLASLSFSLFSLDMDVSDCVFVGMGRSIPKWPKGRVWICNIWSRDQIWSRLVMMDHRLSHSLSLSSLSLSLSLSPSLSCVQTKADLSHLTNTCRRCRRRRRRGRRGKNTFKKFIKAVQLLTWGTGVGVVDKWFTRWVTTSVIRL